MMIKAFLAKIRIFTKSFQKADFGSMRTSPLRARVFLTPSYLVSQNQVVFVYLLQGKSLSGFPVFD